MSQIIYKSLDFLGYPDYQIGSDGTVWSRKIVGGIPSRRNITGPWRKLKTFRSKRNGYFLVRIYHQAQHKDFKVHRLVLVAFIGQPTDGMEGCHNDGNLENNSLDNLRWDTHQANTLDAIRHGALVPLKGEQHGNAKLTEDKVKLIRQLYLSEKHTHRQLRKMFSISRSTISLILKGKAWQHVV